jgi:hypothetical protein
MQTTFSGHAYLVQRGAALVVSPWLQVPALVLHSEEPEEEAIGVDLAASSVGLHRVYREGTTVWAQRSTGSALEWSEPAEVGTDAAEDAIPTVCVSPDDHLFCCYHAADDGTVIRVSRNWGRTWEFHAESGGRFPRMACAPGQQALVNWYVDELRVWYSTNFCTELADPVLAIPASEQLADLDYSWQKWLYLAFSEGGVIFAWTSEDGGREWNDGVVLGSGRKPALVAPLPLPFLGRWTGTPSGSGFSFALLGDIIPLPEQYVGAAFRGQTYYLAAVDEDGELHTYWSGNVTDWEEVLP